MKNTKIDFQGKTLIVYCVDDGYIWPCMVSIYSAFINCDDSPSLSFLICFSENYLSDESCLILREFSESLGIDLKLLSVEDSKNIKIDKNINQTATNAVYLKIKAMDEIPESFLYVDADTLLLPGWTKILEHSKFESDEKSHTVIVARFEGLGANLSDSNLAFSLNGERYFNSGVMIVDSNLWRTSGFAKQWQTIAKNRKDYGFQLNDQDVLNYLLVNRTDELQAEFNCWPEYDSELVASIFHYRGSLKPFRFSPNEIEMFRIAPKAFATKTTIELELFIASFELYWNVERNLLLALKGKSSSFREVCIEARARSGKNNYVDVIMRSKHYLTQLLWSNWRKSIMQNFRTK
jgi:lipopolysaccharide biosynthesis glycosyltransferase